MRKVTNALGKALRETGQALDRVGLTVSGTETFKETYSRHRPVMNVFDKVWDRDEHANGPILLLFGPYASFQYLFCQCQ